MKKYINIIIIVAVVSFCVATCHAEDSLSQLEAFGKASFELGNPGSKYQSRDVGVSGGVVYREKIPGSSSTTFGMGAYGEGDKWTVDNSKTNGSSKKATAVLEVTHKDGRLSERVVIRPGYGEFTKEQVKNKKTVTTDGSGLVVGVGGQVRYQVNPGNTAFVEGNLWTGPGQSATDGEISAGVDTRISKSLRWVNKAGVKIRDGAFAESKLHQETPIGTISVGVCLSMTTVGADMGLCVKKPIQKLFGDSRADGFNPVDQNRDSLNANDERSLPQVSSGVIKQGGEPEITIIR
ncbi:MAG: hypothetical protein WCO05_03875 [Candidatus Moraniibacteriota bacterium]